jgi:hypothetical protein
MARLIGFMGKNPFIAPLMPFKLCSAPFAPFMLFYDAVDAV